MARQEGNGSPQPSQMGGEMRRIAAQQVSQIGPASASAIGRSQAAHRGERRTVSSALATHRAARRGLGVGNWGLGLRMPSSLLFEGTDEPVKHATDRVYRRSDIFQGLLGQQPDSLGDLEYVSSSACEPKAMAR